MSTTLDSSPSLLVKRRLRRTPLGPLFKRTPIWTLMRPRRFHLYCLGAPRTGTTSVAALFKKHYRAEHEPGMPELVDAIAAVKEGTATRQNLLRFLRRHDRELRLELESSDPRGLFADLLPEAFPEAKYLVTVRDCHSWLDSMIDQHLHSYHDPNLPAYWRRLNDLYHQNGARFTAGDRVLERLGLYPLDGYLAFWGEHYRRVLTGLPEDRRLILRTDRLSAEVDRIARFAGVPAETLDTERRHSHKTEKKHRVIEQIDPAYLADKVEEHCQVLMRQFFPEKYEAA